MTNNDYNSLIDEFETFCKDNNLPHMSADELFHEKYEVLTYEQKSYILDFIERWEETEELI